MADKLQAPSKASKRPTNPVTCPDCGSTFSREPDLKRHIMHKVACPAENCHKSFRSDKGNEFMRHVEKEHPALNYGSCHKYFQSEIPNWRGKYHHAKSRLQRRKTHAFHCLACAYREAPKEPLLSFTLSRHQHPSFSLRSYQCTMDLSTAPTSTTPTAHRGTCTMKRCSPLGSISRQAGKIQWPPCHL
jgi:uncharacterized C2H2 Zn-finger protein